MKAVILAGGLGTRISEETHLKPKPMVMIGERPILWHILKIYSHHGINDFIICCGYKGYLIKEFFANYFLHTSNITIDMKDNSMEVHEKSAEPWRITLVDTGECTMTGGRLARVREYIGLETFCFTYGDGLSDVNISELVRFHKDRGTKATLTAVQPPGRFGALAYERGQVLKFIEKPQGDGQWINGGYFVLEPDVIDLISGDDTVWEDMPLKLLADSGELSAYEHKGFWQPMDTLRDRQILEEMYKQAKAPWIKW